MARDQAENEIIPQYQRALSSWDNEGGALGSSLSQTVVSIPELTNAELVQLRIRVIALENLVIALLAGGSDRQLSCAREMASYIFPRPGFTPHPLTVQAAKHMGDLVKRSFDVRDSSSA